jgi:hypothetical protein
MTSILFKCHSPSIEGIWAYKNPSSKGKKIFHVLKTSNITTNHSLTLLGFSEESSCYLYQKTVSSAQKPENKGLTDSFFRDSNNRFFHDHDRGIIVIKGGTMEQCMRCFDFVTKSVNAMYKGELEPLGQIRPSP